MNQRQMTLRRAATFTSVSALLLALVSMLVGYSDSVLQNAVAGAIVGALSGLLTCMAVCGLGDRLMPVAARDSASGTVARAIVGGYVGLIVTSVLVTVAITILGSLNHRPEPFLWGALISSLGGWVLGGLLGMLIGASWSRL